MYPYVAIVHCRSYLGTALVYVASYAGHCYYFLEDVYPRMSGRRLLKTPSLVTALFGGDDHIRPMEQRPTAQPQQPGFPAPGVVPPPGGPDDNNNQGGSLNTGHASGCMLQKCLHVPSELGRVSAADGLQHRRPPPVPPQEQ